MTRTVREVYLKAVVARKFPEGPRGFWGLRPSVGYSFTSGWVTYSALYVSRVSKVGYGDYNRVSRGY